MSAATTIKLHVEVPVEARETVDLDQARESDGWCARARGDAPDPAPWPDAMLLPPIQRPQQAGLGQYITRQEIQERRPYVVTDSSESRGMTLVCSRDRCVPRSTRRNCLPFVVGTGSPRRRRAGGMEPNDLEAIEVYNGVSTVPSEYLRPRDRPQCGMIVVWTRVPPQKRPSQ